MNEILHTIMIESDDYPTVFSIKEIPPTAKTVLLAGQKHTETYKKFLHQNLRFRHQYLDSLIKVTLQEVVASKIDAFNTKQNQQFNASVGNKIEVDRDLTDELFSLLHDQSNDLDELARVLDI